MNNDLRKNVEGYTDPTAAATLNKPESGDIWTYDDGLCLVLKNHGGFSSILLLVDNGGDSTQIEIETTRGVKYTDPRRVTYGRSYKIHNYVETLDRDAFEYIAGAVRDKLGLGLPDALLAHRDALQKENDFLRIQYEQVKENHARAVDRVNQVSFEKMKVVTQLELLQTLVANVLETFRQRTEDRRE